MGLHKYAYIRYQIIDKCLLRKGLKWTWKELAEACGNELRDSYGSHIDNPSERTIKKDLTDMDSLYGEKADLIRKNGKDLRLIEYDRAEKTYYYSDPTFSIDKVALSKEHEKSIIEAIEFLKQFQNLPFFNKFNHAIGKISLAAQQTFENDNIIDFETINNYDGQKNIQPLYNVIKNETEILISYRPFGKYKPEKLKFHPYLLKEYNHRWFVIGWNPSIEQKTIYGLSRITNIEKTKNSFTRNHFFSSSDYFSNILGTSVEIGSDKIEQIILSFNPKRGQYVLTKPIHHSQKILTNDKHEVKIQLMLKINRELITEILSFGADVKVVEPSSFKAKIIKILENVLSMY